MPDNAADALVELVGDMAFYIRIATADAKKRARLEWYADSLSGAVPFTWSDAAFERLAASASAFPTDVVLMPLDLVEPVQLWFFPTAPWNDVPGSNNYNCRTSAVLIARADRFDDESAGFVVALFWELRGTPRRFIPAMDSQWRDGQSWFSASGEDWAARRIELGTEDSIHLGEWTRLAIAGQFWLRSKVAALARASADRGARRRLRRAGNVTTPLVVSLREVDDQQRETDGDGKAVDWTCRWVVRPHWRQQYLPSTGMRRPTLIESYVKGPADKPLRVHAGVSYRVSR
jgi:hypothetical protein